MYYFYGYHTSFRTKHVHLLAALGRRHSSLATLWQMTTAKRIITNKKSGHELCRIIGVHRRPIRFLPSPASTDGLGIFFLGEVYLGIMVGSVADQLMYGNRPTNVLHCLFHPALARGRSSKPTPVQGTNALTVYTRCVSCNKYVCTHIPRLPCGRVAMLLTDTWHDMVSQLRNTDYSKVSCLYPACAVVPTVP